MSWWFRRWIVAIALLISLVSYSASPLVAAPVRSAPVDPASFCASVTVVPRAECEALVALYNSTDGANWVENFGWLRDVALCGWYGVSCSSGHVSGLSLNYNGLAGTLPPELGNLEGLLVLAVRGNQLSGALPPELGKLASLTELDLSLNALSGLPPELGKLTNLQRLNLGANPLRASIPPELGNLVNLRHLLLFSDALNGAIPVELCDLPYLEELNLAYNQIAGTIPRELGSMTTLEDIYLAQNNLSGGIPPELGNLTNLRGLGLEGNRLSGSIPPELGNLVNLEVLYLSMNELTGGLPSELGNLTKLRYMSLHDNHLSGGIPPEFGHLTDLESLSLSNNQLSGCIPPELGNLIKLSGLWLDTNRLSGPLPPELGNLTNLNTLDIHSNAFSGELPLTITYLTNLNPRYVDLGYNALYSSSPEVHDFLSSKDPDWMNTQTVAPSNVQVTDATGTYVSLSWTPIPYAWDGGGYEVSYATTPGGPYTPQGTTASKYDSAYELDGLEPDTIYYLAVRTHTPPHWGQQNDLWSEYSAEISVRTGFNPTIIHTPRVSTFAGRPLTIEATVTSGGRPVMVALHYGITGQGTDTVAQMEGSTGRVYSATIPGTEVTPAGLDYFIQATDGVMTSTHPLTGVHHIQVLTCADVAEIPERECQALLALYDSTGGEGWTDKRGWLETNTPCDWYGVSCGDGHVTALFLDWNRLSGPLPPQLGGLTGLLSLSLVGNQLSGSIPPELGNLTNLTYLSLPSNALSGTIPPELGNLTNLLTLALGFNQLSGAIPPQLGSLSSLQRLYLNSNRLGGSIPPTLANLSNLGILDLSSNRIGGRIPSQLGNLGSLQLLDLSGNRLSGGIPAELGNLSNVQWFYLSNNQLSGQIPSELGNLTSLRFMALAYNMLWCSDPTLLAFLDEKASDWSMTQTVPPTNIRVHPVALGTVELSWTPIPYTWDGGFYEVSYARSHSGPYEVLGHTYDKTINGYLADLLPPGVTYYFAVRTYTPAHGEQQNELWSPYSYAAFPVALPLVLRGG